MPRNGGRYLVPSRATPGGAPDVGGDLATQTLLDTTTVVVRDMCCLGTRRHQSEEEHTAAVHLAFPYRGIFVRHLGRDEAVADANQVLFFNNAEGYRVSHPVPGGD